MFFYILKSIPIVTYEIYLFSLWVVGPVILVFFCSFFFYDTMKFIFFPSSLVCLSHFGRLPFTRFVLFDECSFHFGISLLLFIFFFTLIEDRLDFTGYLILFSMRLRRIFFSYFFHSFFSFCSFIWMRFLAAYNTRSLVMKRKNKNKTTKKNE